MVLVDKRILVGGLSMLIVGIIISVYIGAVTPAGQPYMSDDEIVDLMIAERENEDYGTLSGILIAVGFLLVLVSFGARRKAGGVKKQEEKKTSPDSTI